MQQIVQHRGLALEETLGALALTSTCLNHSATFVLAKGALDAVHYEIWEYCQSTSKVQA